MTSELLEQVTFRDMNLGDEPFIYSSWLKSFRCSDVALGFPNEVYFLGHKKVIALILSRARVLLAVNKEDPHLIYGWFCFEQEGGLPVLHYLYVKRAFRRFGVGHLLCTGLLEQPVQYSHDGAVSKWLNEKSVYNPWAVLGEDVNAAL